MPHLHIARQPVFLANKNVFAYQLLYQPDNTASEQDINTESLKVLTAGFLGVGIGTLTGGKPVIVKFTDYMLSKGLATIFPKEELFIEISPDVGIDTLMFDSLKELKTNGYRLVIYLEHAKKEPVLFDVADIIKADYTSVNKADCQKLIQRYTGKAPIQFLADGIENEADLNDARKLGFSLFKGYFFMKPSTMDVTTVPVSKLNLMLLLTEIVRVEPDIEQIRTDIEMDVGLTYEILKLVNSAFFYRRKKIDSIRNALAYLGIQGIKKWVMMSTLTGQTEANNEVVELSIIRSRFMEQLGMLFVYGNKIEEYTLTGLFSLLETLTNCPYRQLFGQITVPGEVYAILAEGKRESLMGQCLELVESYEKGDFSKAKILAEKLMFTLDQVESMYKASLKWLYENRSLI